MYNNCNRHMLRVWSEKVQLLRASAEKKVEASFHWRLTIARKVSARTCIISSAYECMCDSVCVSLCVCVCVYMCVCVGVCVWECLDD